MTAWFRWYAWRLKKASVVFFTLSFGPYLLYSLSARLPEHYRCEWGSFQKQLLSSMATRGFDTSKKCFFRYWAESHCFLWRFWPILFSKKNQCYQEWCWFCFQVNIYFCLLVDPFLCKTQQLSSYLCRKPFFFGLWRVLKYHLGQEQHQFLSRQYPNLPGTWDCHKFLLKFVEWHQSLRCTYRYIQESWCCQS